MTEVTTDELIAQVLEHDAKSPPGPWTHRDTYAAEHKLVDCYRTAAPLLARKLQRTMEELRTFHHQGVLDEIEMMK